MLFCINTLTFHIQVQVGVSQWLDGSQSLKVAKRALHQAAISQALTLKQDRRTQKRLRSSLNEYVEPPNMRLIAPPRP